MAPVAAASHRNADPEDVLVNGMDPLISAIDEVLWLVGPVREGGVDMGHSRVGGSCGTRQIATRDRGEQQHRDDAHRITTRS